jgi:hypothetical protein
MIQYSRDGSDKSRSRGVLDARLRGHDGRRFFIPSSVASEAKQSTLSLCRDVDFFAPLAMTGTEQRFFGHRTVHMWTTTAAMQFRDPKRPEPHPSEGVILVSGIMFAAI